MSPACQNVEFYLPLPADGEKVLLLKATPYMLENRDKVNLEI